MHDLFTARSRPIIFSVIVSSIVRIKRTCCLIAASSSSNRSTSCTSPPCQQDPWQSHCGGTSKLPASAYPCLLAGAWAHLIELVGLLALGLLTADEPPLVVSSSSPAVTKNTYRFKCTFHHFQQKVHHFLCTTKHQSINFKINPSF